VQELNSYLVLFNKERVLLLKRKDGFWEFPGGAVDWGEDPQQSAVRETKEETGLGARNLTFLTVSSATYEKDGNDKHSVYVVYKGECDSDDVRLSDEHTEHRWLTLTEAKFMKNFGANAEGILDSL
jgi:8-oxo-dGTP pyrophosphatase MutT (NUDIX family)